MNEKIIIEKLFEHDARFIEIKDQIKKDKDEILTGLDAQMVILSRLDQERYFTNHAIKRLEEEIETIKKVLKIA